MDDPQDTGFEPDEIDRRIIELMERRHRFTNVSLARELHMSESAVRKRIDRLIRSDVIRTTVVKDPFKLRYQVVVILGIRVEPRLITGVSTQLASFGELRFVGLTTGAYDFMAEGWFYSQDDLRLFLTEKLWKVEGIVQVDTSHILQMVRYTYNWGVPPPDSFVDGSAPREPEAPQ